MRTSINEKGLLSIYAETPTERYALKQWWRNFQQGDNESRIEALFNEDALDPTRGTHLCQQNTLFLTCGAGRVKQLTPLENKTSRLNQLQ